MTQKTILVSGSKGQLGMELQFLAPLFPKYYFIFHDYNTWDITNEEATQRIFDETKPNFIINCAAYTAVDKAEEDAELAEKVNAKALSHIATEANKYQTHIIHISTDFIFDGKSSTPYTEDHLPAPLSVYGKTKLLGEQNVLKIAKNFTILRTSWVYSSFGKNFVKTMLTLADTKPEIRVVADQIGSPTYAADLAQFILDYLEIFPSKNREIYHFSNQGVASWYDFARSILKFKNKSTPIFPIFSSQYPTPAQRPHYSVMSKEKIEKDFGINIEHWEESLYKCLSILN